MQPSLTRAIKQPEGEVGGDLFRRDRPQALTEPGEHVYPLIKQIYDSALGARSLAASIKTGELGSLRLALSHTIEFDLLIPRVKELKRLFARLELMLLRGTTTEVLDLLKNAAAELALASDLAEQWERLDCWPLLNESFRLVRDSRHRLASRPTVDIADLREEPILRFGYTEHAEQMATLLNNLDIDHGHEIDSERDLVLFLEAGLGIAILRGSTSIPTTLARSAGSISGAPSTFERQRAASAPHPSPRF